jgi:hypothetical protein
VHLVGVYVHLVGEEAHICIHVHVHLDDEEAHVRIREEPSTARSPRGRLHLDGVRLVLWLPDAVEAKLEGLFIGDHSSRAGEAVMATRQVGHDGDAPWSSRRHARLLLAPASCVASVAGSCGVRQEETEARQGRRRWVRDWGCGVFGR